MKQYYYHTRKYLIGSHTLMKLFPFSQPAEASEQQRVLATMRYVQILSNKQTTTFTRYIHISETHQSNNYQQTSNKENIASFCTRVVALQSRHFAISSSWSEVIKPQI